MNGLNQNQMQPNNESTLRQNLKTEFADEDYRYAYAESFLNTKIASQIRTIRSQRELTQAQVASLMGIKQSGYARFEDVNHSVWRTDTMWKIARALDVRVNISLETFGSLIDEKVHFDRQHLERPTFKDDPAFHHKNESNKRKRHSNRGVNVPPKTVRGRRRGNRMNRKPAASEYSMPTAAAIGSPWPEVGASASSAWSASGNSISHGFAIPNGNNNGFSYGK